jgi:hypothetical protein
MSQVTFVTHYYWCYCDCNHLLSRLIVYYMVGLNPNVFGQFLGIVGLTALTAISLGKYENILNLITARFISMTDCLCVYRLQPNPFHLFFLVTGLVISALVPTVEVALALGPPAIIIALLFGGFYSKCSQMKIPILRQQNVMAVLIL